MTPREVRGLQDLAMAAGGSLTINPQTGLAEAGFLEQLIPMLGGAALMAIPGVGPLAAAGIMAGGYGIATGSLEKGLMAGLSAYGGASLGAGLAEMGGSALAEAGGQTAANLGTEAVSNAATQALPTGYSTAGSAFTPTEMMSGSMNPTQFAGVQANAAQSVLTPQNFPGLTPDALGSLQSATTNAANPMDVVKSAGMGNATANVTPAQNMNQGIKDVFGSGSKAMDFLGNNKMALASATLPAVVSAFGEQGNYGGPMTPEEEEEDKLKRISPNFRASVPNRPNPYYQAQYPTYAAGGVAHLPVKGTYSDSDADTAKKPADQAAMIRLNKILAAANMPKAKMPKTNIKGLGDMPEVQAAGGGMMRGIGGYSDGGRMLKGPGDGMSDSIPAVIGSKQPARLADGEFVVPADVVSHLGNGSTDAGAKKLYSMMDKIRKARTGTKKQGKKINPNKYLPA
jgi:hypothetical protein